MKAKKVNLFIYGSLRDSDIFQSVCGLKFSRKPAQVDSETLFAEAALLPHYRSVSPDNVYFYAVASPYSRIDGLVIHDVPAGAMAEIDRYEGKRYEREMVLVNTAGGRVDAQAYLASGDSMEKHFGDRFHVNLIHELWLRKRIEKFIKKRTRPGDRTLDAELERRADRELLATTERDLVISHYHSDAVSDYYLEHELDRPRPSIRYLYDYAQAVPFIRNYLHLVIKQVIFNQLDEQIQHRHRFALEHIRASERYFKRSVSLLMALQMMNANSRDVDRIVQEGLQTMPLEKNDLIDYVKYAAGAAKGMYDDRVARAKLDYIRSNIQHGLVPMGIEVELSNLGAASIEPKRSIQREVDPMYDGFRYFYDFHLDVLTWKLGGYIDDHTGDSDRKRRCGFFELAPGRLNIEGELSRPATADPWLLSQLIREIVEFYDVAPHSLHLSFQLRKRQIGKQKVLPVDFVKCLLALGGGVQTNSDGRLWISRMGNDEIIQYEHGEELVFARTSKRQWYLGPDEIADKAPAQAAAYVQQYKFIRLEKGVNYEPLIMCLKGLQLGYNPAEYLTADQLKGSSELQQQYQELKQWSMQPSQISRYAIRRFIKTVQDGLMNEGHERPAYQLHYIDWILSAIDTQLSAFNKILKKTQNKQVL
jgi:hypothetical protein